MEEAEVCSTSETKPEKLVQRGATHWQGSLTVTDGTDLILVQAEREWSALANGPGREAQEDRSI